MVNPTKLIDDAFFASRSKVNAETGCIEWTRHINEGGYGTLKYKRKFKMAHRFMWEYACGPIPAEMIVCHKCDNRRCINPDHLFIGTTQDNVSDKMAKGRFVPTPGERSGTAKLTAVQIAAIREDRRPQHVIAKDYGVSQSNISFIKRGHTWNFVPVIEDKTMTVREFAALFDVPYDRFRHHLCRQKKGVRRSLEYFGVAV